MVDVQKVKKETLDHIIKAVEDKHSITIQDNVRGEIMYLLNKMHGVSYKSGMEEGIKVNTQMNNLSNMKKSKD